MPKREYSGSPIDQAWKNQTVAEAQEKVKEKITMNQTDGETVAGSTDDDKGSESTTALPSYVNPEDLTSTEKDIIKSSILHPGYKGKEIADDVGCDAGYVSRTLGKELRYETLARMNGQPILKGDELEHISEETISQIVEERTKAAVEEVRDQAHESLMQSVEEYDQLMEDTVQGAKQDLTTSKEEAQADIKAQAEEAQIKVEDFNLRSAERIHSAIVSLESLLPMVRPEIAASLERIVEDLKEVDLNE